MTEPEATLVEQMVAAGEWPTPELLEAIIAQGSAAVPALREVVRRDVHGWPDEAPVYHAAQLLGSIGDPAALPDLMDLFRRYDNETLEPLPDAIGPFGAPALEPLLAVIRDDTLRWYPRAVATGAAQNATRANPELRARLAETLRGLLAERVARAGEIEDDDYQLATSLIVDLAEMADPEARSLIDAAFTADIVETFMINAEDVDRLYREGGIEREPNPHAWLPEHRKWYEGREKRERLAAELAAPKPPKPVSSWKPAPRHRPDAPAGPLSPSPAPRPAPAAGPKRGRNEPCWCGSGKKYKHCHLRQDTQ